MDSTLSRFDPAEYLTDQESVAAYLSDALENEDAHGVVDALRDVVRARGGAARLAENARLDPLVIDAALREGGVLDFDAVLRVLHALGVRLTASLVA